MPPKTTKNLAFLYSFHRRFSLEPISSIPMVVPITTLPAPSNPVLRFFIGQIRIFGLIDWATENVKNMIWTIENLSIPLDRYPGVVLGRGLHLLVQVPEELQDELLVKYPISGSVRRFLEAYFGLSKICLHHSIELIELYLEQFWSAWNMFLGESLVEIFESGANFTYVLSKATSGHVHLFM
jgi:hypothetical protein